MTLTKRATVVRLHFRALLAAFVIAADLALVGCATSNIKQVYQPGTDFSRYHSFAVLPVDVFTATNQPTLSPALGLAAKEAAIEAITNKGLRSLNEDESDLLVNIAGDAIGRQQYNMHAQVQTMQGTVNVYTVDSLGPQIQTRCNVVIELIDRAAKKVVWRGYQTETLMSQPDREAIAMIVKTILATYPPKPAPVR